MTQLPPSSLYAGERAAERGRDGVEHHELSLEREPTRAIELGAHARVVQLWRGGDRGVAATCASEGGFRVLHRSPLSPALSPEHRGDGGCGAASCAMRASVANLARPPT